MLVAIQSKPKITTLGTIMCMKPFTHKAHIDKYVEDGDIKECTNQCKVNINKLTMITISKMGWSTIWGSFVPKE
jgi:hypothetical protein